MDGPLVCNVMNDRAMHCCKCYQKFNARIFSQEYRGQRGACFIFKIYSHQRLLHIIRWPNIILGTNPIHFRNSTYNVS